MRQNNTVSRSLSFLTQFTGFKLIYLSYSYPCSDFTILRKIPTSALMYVNTKSFTLLQSYMLQPRRAILTEY